MHPYYLNVFRLDIQGISHSDARFRPVIATGSQHQRAREVPAYLKIRPAIAHATDGKPRFPVRHLGFPRPRAG